MSDNEIMRWALDVHTDDINNGVAQDNTKPESVDEAIELLQDIGVATFRKDGTLDSITCNEV